jgi:conjugative relaxase-like TrwC/TraI family protein
VRTHRAAVAAALSYLDTHASWSRRGTDGTEQLASDGLVVALFDHRTSRCADPQLHTHALVVNKVRCDDGLWRSLDAAELFHHKKSAGMVYQAALRNEITARLDVAFDEADTHGQAEMIGVPDRLLKLWSKRTAAIQPEAAGKIAEYEASLGRSLTSGERMAVTKTAVLKTGPTRPTPSRRHCGSGGWPRPGRPGSPHPS